ncbi:hypothetical protein FQA39_LY07692 [Lamprigera yunnana]|nr:hypothetical protein FQA39_LY07692 [Lamprigera yunnana]
MQGVLFRMSFFLLPLVFALEDLFVKNEYHNCVAHVQQQIFKEDYPIYYISDGSTPILIPSVNQYVVVNINRPITGSINNPGYYILHVINDKSLKKLLKKLTSSSIWSLKSSTADAYLILTTSEYVDRIFKYLWKEGIPYVYVIYLNEDSSQVYNGDPYEQSNRCGKHSKELYKIGCTQKIEFGKIDRSFEEWELQNYLEVQMAQYYNDSEITEVSSNYGVILKIVKGDANAYTGEPIYVYTFGWVIFVNKISSLLLLQYIFKWEVWVMVGVSLFVTSFAWCLVSKLTTKRWGVPDSLIKVWALTLLGCISKIPQLRSLKCLILLYLFFVIVIQTAFKTNLAQVLTENDEHIHIKNVLDLANFDRPLCMQREFYSMNFLEDKPSDIVYTTIKKKIIQFNNSEAVPHQNCTYLMVLQDIEDLPYLTDSKFKYFVDRSLVKDINTYLVIKKGHHFKVILDRFMTSFIESGFYEYAIRRSKEIKYGKQEMEETSQKVFTMEHVVGIFAIWTIGVFISIVAFVVEIMVKKFETKIN